jgi:UDP-glucuronate 4-epimerase
MTILVTGGAGFIGSHVCEALLAQDHHVVCLDNFDDFYDPLIKRSNITSCRSHPRFELIEGDILDPPLLQRVFEAQRIDLVIHLAARAGVRPSIQNPALYVKVNVEGTLNILEMMRKFSVKKLILASSSSVYGNNVKTPYSETDNVDYAISPYAATKKACEVMAYTYYHLYGIEAFCLRFFTVYGPRQRPEMAIHYFTRSLVKDEPIRVYGDGSTCRDYTFITDIIDGILSCIKNLRGYEVINLGESRTVSLISVIHTIENAVNKKARIQWMPLQAGDVVKTFADIDKARRLVNYDPHVQIEEGINFFVRWYVTESESKNCGRN